MRYLFLNCIFFLIFPFSFAQLQQKIPANNAQFKLKWNKPVDMKHSESYSRKMLSLTDANYLFLDDFLPRISQNIEIQNDIKHFEAVLTNEIYEEVSAEEMIVLSKTDKVKDKVIVTCNVAIHKKQKSGVISFIPIRKNSSTGKYEKLVGYDVRILKEEIELKERQSTRVYASNSVLQTGKWYKIAIASDGIYKIDHTFLKNIGIDVDQINPQNIRVYGNGGEMLSELNDGLRKDDLLENAIYVYGESDGKFDETDYILFYGKGPHSWRYNDSYCPKFYHSIHLYSDSSYYFINVDLGVGKRIQSQGSSSAPVTHNVTSFDDYMFHENENKNFIKSGRLWFGEYFGNTSSYSFPFSFPNIDVSKQVTVKVSLASRYEDLSGISNATFNVTSQSGAGNIVIPEIVGGSYSDYAIVGTTCYSFVPSSSIVTVNINKQTTAAEGWLDYIELNARRALTLVNGQMNFRDAESVGTGNIAKYNIQSSMPLQVWDITDLSNVKSQNLNALGANYDFTLPSDTLKQFIAFDGTVFLNPVFSGEIANQNLHAIGQKDYIIVTHPLFYDEAVQLAQYHESTDTISTIIVTPQQIYNEFSSGSQDISAIRDFVKMFYDRAATVSEMPKYLLLFGDGSYDNKKRFGASNTNFIPTYQSQNSTLSTLSYVSDDFYGLLDDGEGIWNSDKVDIGIGRFPVRTKSEAQIVLNKIFSYTKTGFDPNVAVNSCTIGNNNSPFGDWRNVVCFVGDDEDGNQHISDANKLATLVDTTYNEYNIDKIYFDAFPQESTPGGQRYPGVVDAINKRIEKGCLIFNYTGHGGEVGLAHERVVEVSQINKWENPNNLPLFFTATCEFSRYDDPERTSAGEYVFLNPKGGAIALFTTVRLVYANPNYIINNDFYKKVFEPINGKMPKLGDLYEYIKNQPGGNDINSRNFTLLGDPALTLVYPKYSIKTDSVNSSLVSTSTIDTLKALSKVTISGSVKDKNGNVLNSFNGILYPTVYDKAQTISTLSNDGSNQSPVYNFKIQKNILYRGKVSVTNGMFKFSFVVPKDISYQFDKGRISYYAENGNEDANGFYEQVVIGGTNSGASADQVGPIANVYMNDEKFVFGGLTDENPDLYAVVSDENGVNTVGNGIGHDITAVLDGDTENMIVLNDYYQADLNSYQSGKIRYPFNDLTEGKHTLNLKVWDVYNNSSQTYTEFIVAKSAKLAINHVLNYPNPFTTKTQFFFEHNQCCVPLEAQIQIFTVSGKLVKTINQYVTMDGYRTDPIDWDGRDEFGDKIGRGVYLYKVKIKDTNGATAEKFEKLVILN